MMRTLTALVGTVAFALGAAACSGAVDPAYRFSDPAFVETTEVTCFNEGVRCEYQIAVMALQSDGDEVARYQGTSALANNFDGASSLTIGGTITELTNDESVSATVHVTFYSATHCTVAGDGAVEDSEDVECGPWTSQGASSFSTPDGSMNGSVTLEFPPGESAMRADVRVCSGELGAHVDIVADSTCTPGHQQVLAMLP